MILNNLNRKSGKKKLTNIFLLLESNKVEFSIWAIYIITNFLFIANHEAWRDEAQAWVIAKNCNLFELFNVLSIEGHPCLWYIILFAFSHIGFSFYYISIISGSLMTISSFLLLINKSIKRKTKICILLSSIYMYYNPVIARNYCLVIFIISVLIIIWPARMRYPCLYGIIVGLLFQTHILMAGVAIGCMFDLLCGAIKSKKDSKKYKYVIGFSISLMSMCLLYFELRQPANKPTFIRISPQVFMQNLSYNHIKGAISDLFYILFENPWININILIICAIFVCLILSIIIFKNVVFSKCNIYREFIIWSIGIIWYLFVVIFIKGVVHPQMAICFLVLMNLGPLIILRCNINSKLKNISELGISILCLLTTFNIFYVASYDISNDFSGSKEMSAYIIENLNDDDLIMVHETQMIPAVYAYVKSKNPDIIFWSIEQNQEYKYYIWNESYPNDESEDKMSIPLHNEQYYLVNQQITMDKLELAFETRKNNYWNENYILYKCVSVE